MQAIDYLEVKWNLYSPLFAKKNTGQKTCQKRVCYLAGAWTIPQFLNQAHKGCALQRQSYATGNTNCFLIQLIIRKGKGSPSGKTLLPSPIKTIKRRVVKPSTGSVFSLLFLFLKLHFLANLDALKMLLDYILPEVTWKAVDLQVVDRVEGWSTVVYRCEHANFVLISLRKSEWALFFRLLGENQCECTTTNTEKHRNNLPGLIFGCFIISHPKDF